MPILVTYATTHGSTAEIANRIADRLHQAGYGVDCRPVDHVFSVDTYSAVVLGSAVSSHRWLLDASKFLDVEAMGLQNRPVWTFSVSMAPSGGPGWVRRRSMRKELRELEGAVLRKVPKVKGHVLISGKNDGSDLAMPIRGLYKCFGGRFGDMRDWDAIDSWTDTIAKDLRTDSVGSDASSR